MGRITPKVSELVVYFNLLVFNVSAHNSGFQLIYVRELAFRQFLFRIGQDVLKVNFFSWFLLGRSSCSRFSGWRDRVSEKINKAEEDDSTAN